MIKKFTVSILLILASNAYTQYFGNYKYFQNFSPFETSWRFYDSLVFIHEDSSGQYYKKFYNSYGKTNVLNPANIKITKNAIYHRMERDIDTAYHLLFKLDAVTGDSFYIRLLYNPEYKDTSRRNYLQDSILVKINSIGNSTDGGRQRKTWDLKQFNHSLEDFVDSIGFRRSGLSCSKHGFSFLLYVCNGMEIIHNRSITIDHKFSLLCSSDSFYRRFGYYTSIFSPSTSGESLKIYPNPTSSNIHVKHPMITESSDIKIINILGQKMDFYDKMTNKGTISMDISFLPKGIYTMLIDDYLTGSFMVE
jgi:hypothetical protein